MAIRMRHSLVRARGWDRRCREDVMLDILGVNCRTLEGEAMWALTGLQRALLSAHLCAEV